MRYTRRLLASSTLAALCALPASSASAQAVHPFSVGISAGAAFLVGDDRDAWRDGFAAQGTLAVGFPILPVELRADIGYQTFPGKFRTVQSGTGADVTVGTPDFTVWSGTLSLLARPGGDMGLGIVRPYLAAGGGVYRTDFGDAGGVSTVETSGGLTAALGASVPVAGLNAFFELRVHNIFREGDSMRTYPVVAGFLF